MQKKLYRRREGRVFAGVCAGIADYFDVDPVIVRVVWLICSFIWGSGLLAYLLCIIIIPEEY